MCGKKWSMERPIDDNEGPFIAVNRGPLFAVGRIDLGGLFDKEKTPRISPCKETLNHRIRFIMGSTGRTPGFSRESLYNIPRDQFLELRKQLTDRTSTSSTAA